MPILDKDASVESQEVHLNFGASSFSLFEAEDIVDHNTSCRLHIFDIKHHTCVTSHTKPFTFLTITAFNFAHIKNSTFMCTVKKFKQLYSMYVYNSTCTMYIRVDLKAPSSFLKFIPVAFWFNFGILFEKIFEFINLELVLGCQ